MRESWEPYWFWEPAETRDYRKNLWRLQWATEQLLSHMKGHDYSFRREITDPKGRFSHEKLCSLVEEMLSFWKEELRDGSFMNPTTGESVTEAYLQARLELYRYYLYLVMRCSLCQWAYSNAGSGAEEKEQTNFAFLLKQAKRLSQDWCVMAEPDGKRRNEPYNGYDGHFGFHLYRPFSDPDGIKPFDCSLTPDWKRACDQPIHFLTDEGNTKRISIKRLGTGRMAEPPAEKEEGSVKEPALSNEENDNAAKDYDVTGEDDAVDDYIPAEEDGAWDFPEEYDGFWQTELERLSEEGGRKLALSLLYADFECREEYFLACEGFKNLFEQAGTEVLKDFYADLEEIVDVYLVKRGIAPLMDADKALDVYGRLCDGALRQAERYGRGVQWKGL